MQALTTPSTALPPEWIERLFGRMASAYGSLFADRWRGVDLVAVRRDWAEQLGGFTRDELRRGIANLPNFPPTLPEFKALCRPKPHPEAAFAEAGRLIGRLDGWSDCSVFWAAREIGAHDLKSQPYHAVRGRWLDAMDRHWRDRKPIPEPAPVVAVIPPDVAAQAAAKPLTEDERKALLERVRSWRPKGIVVTRPAESAPDPDAELRRAAEREIEGRAA